MGQYRLRWGSGIVLSVAVVASVAADSAPKPTAPAPPTLDDARKLAASAGKALVLEFSTDWCSACKVFEQQTLPDASVQAALSNVVFVRYDAEAAPGDEAARRYKVHVFPTFIAVDENGVAALRTHAKACRASSGAEMEGAVRLKFDASGEIIVSSTMLDASAPAGLRTCLAKEIATLKLKVPKRTTKVTLPIEFR